MSRTTTTVVKIVARPRRNRAFASMSAADWSRVKRQTQAQAQARRVFERDVYRPLTRTTRTCGVVVCAVEAQA